MHARLSERIEDHLDVYACRLISLLPATAAGLSIVDWRYLLDATTTVLDSTTADGRGSSDGHSRHRHCHRAYSLLDNRKQVAPVVGRLDSVERCFGTGLRTANHPHHTWQQQPAK